jgi:N-acetylneuraminic acid mutarotase
VGDLLEGREQPASNSVWRWEPLADKWKRVAYLPRGIGGGALVKVDRELHFFGGCFEDRVTNSGLHWVFGLGATTSAVDDGARWVQKRSLPKARDHLSGVALDGKVYAIGGEFGHDVRSVQTGYVHCFDPATNTWTRRASLPIFKSHMETATIVFEGKIVVGGGQVTGRGPSGDVQQYDQATNSWVGVKSLPRPSQGGALQRLGEHMIVTLGAKKTNEPTTDTWIGRVRT